MLRPEGFKTILYGFLVGIYLSCPAVVFAEPAVTNDELLMQIRELKNTVQRQQQTIESLERRVTTQELTLRAEAAPAQSAGDQLLDGVKIGFESTTIVQAVRNANGPNQLSNREDATDASMTAKLSFEKSFDDYGSAYVLLKSGPGSGVDQALRLYGNVNNNAIDNSGVLMPEAWYEQHFKRFPLTLTFGKLDATNYIDTNEYANTDTSQFLSLIFGNSPVIEFPASNGAGVRFSAVPSDLLDVELLAVDSKAGWTDVFDSMFLAGQVNFKPQLFRRGGNYRLIAWRSGDNHTKWMDTTRDKENGYGWGVSIDQELTDIFGIFARYGWQDPDVYLNGSDFSLERSWSLGPQVKGSLWGRPDDVTGVGFGQIKPSDKYRDANSLLAKTESHFEWYYNCKVNDHLWISPDLQIIWRPYGKDAANGDGTIVVTGLRGQVEF
ncbi:MAG TPA: carbohydrate porin [Candidatus Omnitrophota bacterium]|nr:carbohydrate porin [Candidatus Omnitrophota bacterium]